MANRCTIRAISYRDGWVECDACDTRIEGHDAESAWNAHRGLRVKEYIDPTTLADDNAVSQFLASIAEGTGPRPLRILIHPATEVSTIVRQAEALDTLMRLRTACTCDPDDPSSWLICPNYASGDEEPFD